MALHLQQDYALKKYNTFGIEAKADYFFAYNTEEELQKNLPQLNKLKLPYLMIGEGSNLLFINDYKGIVIHSKMTDISLVSENKEEVIIGAGSGVIWDNLVAWAVERNYFGIENLSNIPGTVGASPVQNIGAYGVEAKDVIETVEALAIATGEKHIFNNKECKFDYRKSIFKGKLKGQYIVTSVYFKLSKKPHFILNYGNIKSLLGEQQPTLKKIREIITEVRDNKLPNYHEMGNAGSFFTNPYISTVEHQRLKKEFPEIPAYPIDNKTVKIPAGWLIEQAGLKGFQHKNAAVHHNQALVLVNKGGATGQEVLELAEIIIAKVKTMFKITLIPEVNMLQ